MRRETDKYPLIPTHPADFRTYGRTRRASSVHRCGGGGAGGPRGWGAHSLALPPGPPGAVCPTRGWGLTTQPGAPGWGRQDTAPGRAPTPSPGGGFRFTHISDSLARAFKFYSRALEQNDIRKKNKRNPKQKKHPKQRNPKQKKPKTKETQNKRNPTQKKPKQKKNHRSAPSWRRRRRSFARWQTRWRTRRRTATSHKRAMRSVWRPCSVGSKSVCSRRERSP